MVVIYLVTSGEYSDYSVDGAFSSEKLANQFIKIAGGSIEPWEMDERRRDRNCPHWYATLDLKTGGISAGSASSYSEIADPNTRVGYVKYYDYSCIAHPEGHINAQSYISQKHANKLCVEKRQEILRTGILTTTEKEV